MYKSAECGGFIIKSPWYHLKDFKDWKKILCTKVDRSENQYETAVIFEPLVGAALKTNMALQWNSLNGEIVCEDWMLAHQLIEVTMVPGEEETTRRHAETVPALMLQKEPGVKSLALKYFTTNAEKRAVYVQNVKEQLKSRREEA